MIVKFRKCKARDPATSLRCNALFEPISPWQQACSQICAIHISAALRFKNEEKERRRVAKERKAGLDKLKTRGDYLREAQIAYNGWRRESLIAQGHGCISCGTHNGKMNCGHYRSVGSSPELRFELLNTWVQCERCNTSLSGNLILYRQALVKMGIDVEWLEGTHESKHYSTEDLKDFKTKYLRLTRELKKEN